MLRRQTAECAQKVLWAADAFDQYAACMGEYPPDGELAGAQFPCAEMIQTFASMNIDWWGEATDLGGVWDWFRRGDQTGYIAITKPAVSEASMRRLDCLIDDGDLYSGMFRQYGYAYCYILTKQKYACVSTLQGVRATR
ncbi:hypothetical protein [Tichowtungia aerotolerans]|uniref:Uncharacterized protein n=1 Tax=Tichowtungia aerotolerans TaxID=2697043 RepID=A0A6P1MGX7_9BACT|nr:hypothetical protein [Tichowtungia aerotolerans]QHI70836.1 hypothetical protein GT409_15765 [Tichowtungia aerotolerans]